MSSIGVPGWKMPDTPIVFSALDILIGNNPPDKYQHIIHFILLQKVHDTGDDGVVRAGEDGKAMT